MSKEWINMSREKSPHLSCWQRDLTKGDFYEATPYASVLLKGSALIDQNLAAVVLEDEGWVHVSEMTW